MTTTYTKYGTDSSGYSCDCVMTQYTPSYRIYGVTIPAVTLKNCMNSCCGDSGGSSGGSGYSYDICSNPANSSTLACNGGGIIGGAVGGFIGLSLIVLIIYVCYKKHQAIPHILQVTEGTLNTTG